MNPTFASLMTALLFLITPFAAYGVAAEHGGEDEEHCTDVFPPGGAFDALGCAGYVSSLGPSPADACADGATDVASDASDDPLWLQACTLAFSLAGVNGITIEFHDHADVAGSPDDHDGDGRPDVAKVLIPHPFVDDFFFGGDNCDGDTINVDDPESGDTLACVYESSSPVYIQLDFFYTPDQYGERKATSVENWDDLMEDEFDIPVSGIMTYWPDDGALLNSGDNYRFTNHYNHDLAARGETFTPHYGIYQAASPVGVNFGTTTGSDFGTCLVCIEPANQRLAILAGPDTWDEVNGDLSSKGMLKSVTGGISLDLDGTAGDSIVESGDDPFGSDTLLLLHVQSLPRPNLGFPGDANLNLNSLLHIKEPLTGTSGPLYYQYSNLDDDRHTDFQELTCTGQATNPTNPAMHCDDWDGDGLDNADDNDPRTPLTLFEIIGSPSGEAPLTEVAFTFRCLDQTHDEAISFSAGAGWAPDITGPVNCGTIGAPMTGGDPRREGTVTFTHAGALNPGANNLNVPGFEMTATYSGAPDTKSATATILGNAIESGTLRVEITHRDGSPVSGALYEAQASSGSATLTIPDYAADENGETHGFAVELTWTPDTSAEDQATTSVRFGTSAAANCNSPTSFHVDSNSADGFTATSSIPAQDAGHTVRYCVERTDTGGRTGWADPRIDVVVPEKNLINAIPALSGPGDQHVETANDEATVAFKIEVTDLGAAGRSPGATGGEAPTDGPNLYWFKGTNAQALAAGTSDFTMVPMGEPETCPRTPTVLTPHPTFCTAQPTLGVGLGGPTSTPPADNNGDYDDGERHVANVQIPWTQADSDAGDIHVWYYFDVLDAAQVAASTSTVLDNGGSYYQVTPAAAPLEFMGQEVLPNPISMLLRPECGLGSTEPTCYDDIANPLDTAAYRNNEGNLIFEEGANDQLDLVEQFLLSVDAPGEGTGGRAAVHWYSTKDGTSGIVTPDDTESGRISVGDSDLTTVVEYVVVNNNGAWHCIFQDDVSPQGEVAAPTAFYYGTGGSEASACNDKGTGSDYQVDFEQAQEGVYIRVLDVAPDTTTVIEIFVGNNPYDSYVAEGGDEPESIGERLENLRDLIVGFEQMEDGTWWITLVDPDSCPTTQGVPRVDSQDCDYVPLLEAPGQGGSIIPTLPDEDGDGEPDITDSCPEDANTGTDADGDGVDSACDPDDTDPDNPPSSTPSPDDTCALGDPEGEFPTCLEPQEDPAGPVVAIIEACTDEDPATDCPVGPSLLDALCAFGDEPGGEFPACMGVPGGLPDGDEDGTPDGVDQCADESGEVDTLGCDEPPETPIGGSCADRRADEIVYICERVEDDGEPEGPTGLLIKIGPVYFYL